MPQSTAVVPLTRKTLPIFINIFGDLPGEESFRGNRRSVRRSSRIPIEFLRTHGATDAEMCHAQCVDISEEGIGFYSRVAVPVGEVVEVFLPGESQDYSVRAKIVHAAEKAGHYRIGACFVWD